MNQNNEIVVPLKYDSIGEITEGKIYVKKNSRAGACDNTGKEIIEDRRPFATNLEIGKFFEKYGIMDAAGNKLLDFKYDSISLINDICIKADRYLFKLNGELLCSNIDDVKILTNGMMICRHWGSIIIFDSKFHKLLDEYNISDISDFKEGKAIVTLVGGKKGAITEDGKIVIERVEPLSENLIKQKIMGNWGVKTTDDKWLYPAKYDDIICLENNVIILVAENYFTIIDNQGILIKEFVGAKFVSQINNSLFLVKSKGRFGICNRTGDYILQCSYSDIRETINGYIITQKTEKAWAWSSSESYVYGLLDSNGKIILEGNKQNIIFKGNCIFVDDNRLHIVYDMSMNKLCEYYHEEMLKSGYRKISLSRFGYGKYTQWGIVNSEWRLIVPCHFEEITILSDDWFALKRNGKWGCVSTDLSQSYPCVYPNISMNSNNIPSVKIGNKIIPCHDFIERKRLEINHSYSATIDEIRNYGLMVKVDSYKCLLHISEIKKHGKKITDYKVGDNIEVLVLSFDKNKRRYSLILK